MVRLWDVTAARQVEVGARGVNVTQSRMVDLNGSRESSNNTKICVEHGQQRPSVAGVEAWWGLLISMDFSGTPPAIWLRHKPKLPAAVEC